MTALEKHVRQYVEAAKSAVPSITAPELAGEIERGEVTVVDVGRADERHDHGAIPESIWVPRGDVEYAADPESQYYDPAFDLGDHYVCYCSGGGRGALAAARLAEMGYPDVAYLGDGFAGWVEAGYEVEKVH